LNRNKVAATKEKAQIDKSRKNITQRGILFVAGNILFKKLIINCIGGTV
jgi:hypothetical protein